MRKNLFITTILTIFLLALLFLFDRTPYVHFSKESGFYDAPFKLVLSGSTLNSKIYYTLDGSIPNENSILYDEPILISDASCNENTISMRTDVSAVFKIKEDPRIQLYTQLHDFKVPDTLIDKATVIKAIAIDGDKKSEIITKTFFVGYSDKFGYDDVGIISIVMDPYDLFDYYDGIYVTGATFDKYFSDESINNYGANAWSYKSNYSIRGKANEKEANITFFDKNRKIINYGNYGVRISGSSSRVFTGKSLNIYSRSEYGSKAFSKLLLETNSQMKKITLNNGSNSNPLKIHNLLISEICNDLNLSMKKHKPYVAFLNGEYWGFYFLTESFDEQYFKNHFDVDKDNVIVVEETGNRHNLEFDDYDNDIDLYESMVDFVSNNDMSNEDNYKKAKSLIDMDSCVDFYALEIYINNTDWPNKNMRLWRTRETDGNYYSDGRWRYILYDVDASFTTYEEIPDIIDRIKKLDPLFHSLMENEEFRIKLNNKFYELANNYFNLDRIMEYLSKYINLYEDELSLNYDRFYGKDNNKLKIVNHQLSSIRDFCAKRESSLKEYTYSFGSTLYFDSNNADSYRIKKDGFSIPENNLIWTNDFKSSLYFNFSELINDDDLLQVEIELSPFNKQNITILLDDKIELYKDNIQSSSTIKFNIFGKDVNNNSLKLTFDLPDAISPLELGISQDSRILALQIHNIVINKIIQQN